MRLNVMKWRLKMSNNTPDYNDNLYFDCTVGDNDLTVQWRKGELPEGWYWVLYKSDAVEPAEYQKWFNEKTQSYYTEFDCEEDIVAVIDNISYSAWFNMKHLALLANECLHERDKLREQIEHVNRLIQWVRRSSWSCNQEEDDFDKYVKKWGVR